MITRRAYTAWSCPERHLLKPKRLQSGQCVRCFHPSIQRRAEEHATEVDDNGTTHNGQRLSTRYQGSYGLTSYVVAPQRAPTRQQRAARISNEVSMLQNGPPPGDPTTGPGSVKGTYQSDPQAPTTSAGFAETPQSMGGERMGENVSAGREGPNAQGVGRLTGSDERVRNEHPAARSTRMPGEVQEPAEGAPSVIEATTPGLASEAARVARSQTIQRDMAAENWSEWEENALRHKLADAKPLGVPFRVQPPRARELLHSGSSAATPASNGFKSVVLDRLKSAVSPAEALHGRPNGNRLSKETSGKISRALVAGQYDPSGRLAGNEQYKQATMNEAAKRLMMNGSYLTSDGKRFLKKIQTLLPAAIARPPPKKTPAKA